MFCRNRDACSSVGTKSRFCWKRGKVDEDGEKKETVKEEVGKGDKKKVEGCGQVCHARV